MRPIHFVVLAATLSAAAALPAAEGDYEIDQACVAVGCFPGDTPGFPVTLANDGNYRLSSDLIVNANASTDALYVSADRVDLDLGGHVIDAGGRCSGTPLTCSGAAARRGINSEATGAIVRVRNGVLRGTAQVGVAVLLSASGTRIEDLLVSDVNAQGIAISGVAGTELVSLERVRCIRNNGSCGRVNTGARMHVSNSEFAYSTGVGLIVDGGSLVVDSHFVGNAGLGLSCSGAAEICAIGRNFFFSNNQLPANAQYGNGDYRSMGGNVCEDGACP
jgi:hypothetical protein